MNTVTRVCNVLYMLIVFLNVLSVQGMEPNKEYLLWLLNGHYPLNSLVCYLAHGVDATKRDIYGDCLLHQLVYKNCYGKINNVGDFLKQGELLLHTIPGMVNALNNRGETPVDVAYIGLKQAHLMRWGTPEAFTKLSYLYKSHGGKTGQQLLRENMIFLLHNDSCIGDLAILPHDVRKYIVGYMMLYFKKQITEEAPNDPYDCSICRDARKKNKS